MSERHLFPELRIRSKMREIMIKEASSCDLKELVAKFIPESIGKDIEKANSGHLPSSECFHPLSQDPKFDLGKKLKEALHGDYTAVDVGVKVDRPAVEEPTEIIGA
ncbi:40S ribosomal protein S3a-like [Brassica rapa]|uniref:Uncharacterized protein n=3 Tax=Brassica TaxID=3705 RepID=A0ABQ8EKH3_BRANA|nr:40S ribosomal protein S3a-like [Brassica rapa]XP_048598878.1 40S ribosomal protein S3a-like [Brassica napus]KAH0942090.1 hypothetical protein HID58_001727 [Brassica napus]